MFTHPDIRRWMPAAMSFYGNDIGCPMMHLRFSIRLSQIVIPQQLIVRWRQGEAQ